MLDNISEIFPIFFLTLGPVKTIPIFYVVTKAATEKFRQKVARESIFIATALCLFIGFVGRSTLDKWGVDLEALQLTGGLILLIKALKVIALEPPPAGGQKITADTPLAMTKMVTFSPIVIPNIITPYGVVAILFFMVIARGNPVFQNQIISLIFLMMLLNYLGMIFAHKIMGFLGFPILRLIGWVFAIMQASLAIDIMLAALRSLGVIQRTS